MTNAIPTLAVPFIAMGIVTFVFILIYLYEPKEHWNKGDRNEKIRNC